MFNHKERGTRAPLCVARVPRVVFGRPSRFGCFDGYSDEQRSITSTSRVPLLRRAASRYFDDPPPGLRRVGALYSDFFFNPTAATSSELSPNCAVT